MARKCIFCGKRANSVEDAIPLWLARRYPAEAIMDLQLGEGQPVISYQVKQPELRVKRVCRKCNNEWMNRLEERTKPIIIRLQEEPSCELDIHDCQSLALWTCKTAMVMEATKPPVQWVYTELDRCLLSLKDLMPESVEVWIVKCAEALPSARDWAGYRRMPISPERAGIATLCFSPLVIPG